jgi:hypothetical protein
MVIPPARLPGLKDLIEQAAVVEMHGLGLFPAAENVVDGEQFEFS